MKRRQSLMTRSRPSISTLGPNTSNQSLAKRRESLLLSRSVLSLSQDMVPVRNAESAHSLFPHSLSCWHRHSRTNPRPPRRTQTMARSVPRRPTLPAPRSMASTNYRLPRSRPQLPCPPSPRCAKLARVSQPTQRRLLAAPARSRPRTTSSSLARSVP